MMNFVKTVISTFNHKQATTDGIKNLVKDRMSKKKNGNEGFS